MEKKLLTPFLVAAIGLSLFSTAHAVSSYRNQFNTTYPASTAIGQCQLCHPGGNTGSFTGYANAFRANNHDFRAIENLDSDGDGFSNIVEINALSYPGDPASLPAAADTTAPAVTAFTVPATSSSLTVAISSFTASDAVGVTGYRVTETATAPTASATGWSASAPTSYTFATAGGKTLYAWARDAAGNVSASRSASVSITITSTLPPAADTTAPAVTAFTVPATSSSLTVAISSFTASDAVGVTGYRITETATAPTASATGWSASAPTSYTFATAGTKTLYAWAKDTAGNVSASRSASVSITSTLPPAADTTAPAVTAFTVPATSGSLTVRISSFTASDAVGVTGYRITETATTPAVSAAGWIPTAPATYSFATTGTKTLYAWAKDAAGNISAGRSASVSITITSTLPPVADTTAPTVTAFTVPATSSSLTVGISSLTATDNVGVIGYRVTETATAPASSGAGWSASAPTSYTFAAAGAKTLYAWAKDTAGNVSAGRSASLSVTSTFPPAADTTPPAVASFTIPATSNSLTVSITSFVATDNVAVTGLMVTESPTAPAANAAAWSASAPASYTLAGANVHTLYAWAKDAAGNVSAGRSASTTITVPPPPPPPSAALPAFSTPTQVTNPYFPLATVRSTLRGTIGREPIRVERRLLDSRREFRVVAKTVRTLILEDRLFVDGDLEEVALSYVAQADDGGVYLFGVNVSTYSNGRVVGHEGSWLYGADTDQPGILIPASPQVGMIFQGENVAEIVQKESEVVSISEIVMGPAGTFRNSLKIMEVFSDGTVEYKYYAPGVGLVKEVFANGELNLTSRSSSRSDGDDRESDDDHEDD